FGPPLLIFTLDRHPELEPMLLPPLLSLLRPIVSDRAKASAEAKELMADMGQGEPDEELMAVLEVIVGGPPQEQVEEPVGDGQVTPEPSPDLGPCPPE